MANPVRGEAELVFKTKDGLGDEQTVRLKLVADFNAFCEAEEFSGMDSADLLQKFYSGSSVRSTRALFCALLQRNHAELAPHPAAAGDLMGEIGPKKVAEAVKAAIEASTKVPAEQSGEAGAGATEGP